MLKCILCKITCEHGEVSLHRFPVDSELKKLWCEFVGKDITANSRLCSRHFNDSDFIYKPSGLRYLKKDAVPIIYQIGEKSNRKNKNTDDAAFTSPLSQPSISGHSEQQAVGKIKFEKTDSDEDMQINIKGECPEEQAVGKIKFEKTDSDEDMQINIKGIKTEDVHLENMSFLTSSESESYPDLVKNEEVHIVYKSETLTEPETEEAVKNQQSDDSGTITSSESEESSSLFPYPCSCIPQRTFFRNKRQFYFGDCSTDDMSNPQIATRNWQVAAKTVAAQRKKIKSLQQTNRRLKAKVSCLNSLVEILKNKISHQ